MGKRRRENKNIKRRNRSLSIDETEKEDEPQNSTPPEEEQAQAQDVSEADKNDVPSAATKKAIPLKEVDKNDVPSTDTTNSNSSKEEAAEEESATQAQDDVYPTDENDVPSADTKKVTLLEEAEEEETAQEKQDTITPLTTTNMSTSDGRYHNKQRCLIVCARGVTARYRHLLEDLRRLVPHHKKDSKLDTGKESVSKAINYVANMKSCNAVVFLECRKRQDAYLYLGLAPDGPSVKCLLSNVHTMDELRLTGNSMSGSRPVLSFDDAFERWEHLKLLRVLFTDIFGTPRGHPKSKPFVDRVMGFYYVDKKIWVRNYQIQEEEASNAKEAHHLKQQDGLRTSLVEIGPRFVLDPIRIFGGCFWGQTLYKNDAFVSPNTVRSERSRKRGNEYEDRKQQKQERQEYKTNLVVPEDPLDSVFRDE